VNNRNGVNHFNQPKSHFPAMFQGNLKTKSNILHRYYPTRQGGRLDEQIKLSKTSKLS